MPELKLPITGDIIDKPTTVQVKHNPNPTGKGGFGDHPESINPGGKPKNAQSFTYWYRTFKDMDGSELDQWQKDNPQSKRTIASHLALARFLRAEKDLKEYQEIADRSEGKPVQKHLIDPNVNLTQELNKLENTNYNDLGQQAQQQVVAPNASLQDPGQAGEPSNLPAQPDATSTPSGEGSAPIQPNT